MDVVHAQSNGTRRDGAIVLQALSIVVPDGRGSYLSAPISTGRRYMEAMADAGVDSHDALIGKIGMAAYLERVRRPNVRDGEEYANRLRAAGVLYVVNTGPLFIEGWSGRDYMDLCFSVIERKIQTVYFHPEWASSEGAVEEYFFSVERGLKLVAPEGGPLTPDLARASLAAVRDYARQLSLPTLGIDQQLRKLDTAAAPATPAATPR